VLDDKEEATVRGVRIVWSDVFYGRRVLRIWRTLLVESM